MEQITGPKNEAPPAGVRSALLRDLAALGLRIVAADPQSALWRLEQRTRSRPRADDDEDDLWDEDDDVDGIAA